MRTLLPLICLAVLAACSGSTHTPTDAGPADAGRTDAGPGDAGSTDAGPQPDDGGSIAAQLNDVSILFPLPASDADLDGGGLLHANSAGDRGALLPEPLYDALGHISGSSDLSGAGGVGNAHWADLRVVAVRLDPCFADTAPDPHGAGCQPQLRLVMQEVLDRGGIYAFDSALHVFYSLTRAELLEAARSLVALREANNPGGVRLGALAPHPLIVQQGLGGAYAEGVKALVLRYAGASNLIRVTELSATNPGFAWVFEGFDVTAANPPTFASMVIPTLPGTATQQTFFRGFASDMQGQFDPSTTDADDLTLLAAVGAADAADAGVRAAAFDSLVRIENPTRHTPNTIDCASCHLATPEALDVAGPRYGLTAAGNPFAFVPDPRFVTEGELGPTFSETSGFNVHAFSYVGDAPGINQRTVNESAAIATYLNTLQ